MLINKGASIWVDYYLEYIDIYKKKQFIYFYLFWCYPNHIQPPPFCPYEVFISTPHRNSPSLNPPLLPTVSIDYFFLFVFACLSAFRDAAFAISRSHFLTHLPRHPTTYHTAQHSTARSRFACASDRTRLSPCQSATTSTWGKRAESGLISFYFFIFKTMPFCMAHFSPIRF